MESPQAARAVWSWRATAYTSAIWHRQVSVLIGASVARPHSFRLEYPVWVSCPPTSSRPRLSCAWSGAGSNGAVYSMQGGWSSYWPTHGNIQAGGPSIGQHMGIYRHMVLLLANT
eukprot:1195676-Prorocentrum_minimum.AAC.8